MINSPRTGMKYEGWQSSGFCKLDDFLVSKITLQTLKKNIFSMIFFLIPFWESLFVITENIEKITILGRQLEPNISFG